MAQEEQGRLLPARRPGRLQSHPRRLRDAGPFRRGRPGLLQGQEDDEAPPSAEDAVDGAAPEYAARLLEAFVGGEVDASAEEGPVGGRGGHGSGVFDGQRVGRGGKEQVRHLHRRRVGEHRAVRNEAQSAAAAARDAENGAAGLLEGISGGRG